MHLTVPDDITASHKYHVEAFCGVPLIKRLEGIRSRTGAWKKASLVFDLLDPATGDRVLQNGSYSCKGLSDRRSDCLRIVEEGVLRGETIAAMFLNAPGRQPVQLGCHNFKEDESAPYVSRRPRWPLWVGIILVALGVHFYALLPVGAIFILAGIVQTGNGRNKRLFNVGVSYARTKLSKPFWETDTPPVPEL